MSRTTFPKASEHFSTGPRQLIHIDLYGPLPVKTPSGKRYIINFVDDYSRHCQLFLLAKKSEASTVITNYVENCITQFNQVPKIFRSDRGGEYLSHQVSDYLETRGIERQLTAPYSPQQNGVAERKNRYLLEATRIMLIEAELPKKYWGKTVITVCYLQNRLPTKNKTKTPFEL